VQDFAVVHDTLLNHDCSSSPGSSALAASVQVLPFQLSNSDVVFAGSPDTTNPTAVHLVADAHDTLSRFAELPELGVV
jgi:hypothetical protein